MVARKWFLVLSLVAVLAVAALPAFAQFPTPEVTPLDPVDTINAGVYTLDTMGLLPVVGVFIGLIVAGVIWRMVRPRGR